MIEKIKSLLRGRHNSLKLKYIILPRDYVIETWFRLTGRKWIDFYKYRMDREDRTSKQAGSAPTEGYLDIGQQMFQYLTENGMKSGDRLLDYGCGVMRLRLWTENTGVEYFGVDISQERIDTGVSTLRDRGIEMQPDHAVVVDDYELTALKHRDFDYVWAASVYTHIPVDEIIISLQNIKKFMKPTGKMIFTFSPAPANEVVRQNQKDWWQPPAVMEDCARKAGFDVTIADRWTVEGGGMAAILTIPSAEQKVA